MVARATRSFRQLLSSVTLSSEKTQWELFCVAWTCCDLFVTWIWEIVYSWWNGDLGVRLGLIEAVFHLFFSDSAESNLTHCVEWTKCTLYRSQYCNTIAVYAQCLFIEDLELFSDQFVKLMVLGHDWPDCRGMFWVIQLHSIIHTVEMIRYYLVSTTGLKYDCFEELEAFGWSDVENESS